MSVLENNTNSVLMADPKLDKINDIVTAQPEFKKAVVIRLMSLENLLECNFWIGLATHGKLTPGDLLLLDKTTDILSKVAKDGLADELPLMISDSEHVPNRYFYLLPIPENQTKQKWMKKLLKTLKELSLRRVGFYFSEEFFSTPEVEELLRNFIEEISLKTALNEIYIFITPENANKMLNSSLKLKKHFEERGKMQLLVFH